MNYAELASRLSNTFVSDLPGIKRVHSMILDVLEWKYQLGEEWVEYSGAMLYADTSDFVAKRIAIRGKYEPQVSENIKNLIDEGDFAIDVGAHIGHHTVTMRQCVGSDGRIWAFEPNPKNINYINKTLDKNRWSNIELFSIALSNDKSSNQLLIPDSGNTGRAALSNANIANYDAKDSYTVETRQLTSILNERQIDEINLLKIDVEGGEIDIIKDISNDLDIIDSMIVELHTEMLDEEDVRDVFKLLKSSGVVTDLNGDIVEIDEVLTENTSIIWQSEGP